MARARGPGVDRYAQAGPGCRRRLVARSPRRRIILYSMVVLPADGKLLAGSACLQLAAAAYSPPSTPFSPIRCPSLCESWPLAEFLVTVSPPRRGQVIGSGDRSASFRSLVDLDHVNVVELVANKVFFIAVAISSCLKRFKTTVLATQSSTLPNPLHLTSSSPEQLLLTSSSVTSYHHRRARQPSPSRR
jgi:hypothetical protein